MGGPKPAKPITIKVEVEIENIKMDSKQAKKEIQEEIGKKINEIIYHWRKQLEEKENEKLYDDMFKKSTEELKYVQPKGQEIDKLGKLYTKPMGDSNGQERSS